MANPLSTQENEALRRALWLDFNQEVTPAVSDPDIPTDVTGARQQVREELRRFLPAGPPVEDTTRFRSRVPRRPRYKNYHTDQFAGAGASAERFTFRVTSPVLIEEVILHISNGDASSSHIHLLIRRGDDTTAGLTDDDLEFFTNPDPTAGIGAIMAASTGEGGTNILVDQAVLDVPFRFHVRALNAAGVTPLHFNAVFRCRIIEGDELDEFTPAPLLAAAIWGVNRVTHMAPRRRLAPRTAPQPNLMQVCGPGYCRNIPWALMDKNLKREYIVAQINNEPTPGMRLLS